ncbi:MAG: hypothetical protein ABW221_07670 [Vicinamibacteria bacterium]
MTARSLFLAGLALSAALPAAADNEVVNPGFVADLSGWTFVGGAVTATHDASQSFNSPGSVRVESPGGPPGVADVLRQCRAVSPGTVLDLGGKTRFASGHANNLKGFASVSWFTDAACGTSAPSPGVFSNVIADVPDTWLPIHAGNVAVPAGVGSAFFTLAIGLAAGEGVAWFDDVYFGPAPLSPVELMGFGVE